MNKTELAKAVTGAILGLTKFAKVLEAVTDDLIIDNNQAAVGDLPDLSSDQPIAKVTSIQEDETGITVTATKVNTASVAGEVDDEGRPWIEGVHAGSKGLVNSKNVKGGKAWRLAKGVDKEVVEKFYADYPIQEVAATLAAAPVATSPLPTGGLPGAAPVAASPLPTGGLPGAAVDEYADIRKSIALTLKTLIDSFELSWDDLKEMMVTEFKVAQNGEQVVLGSVPVEKYDEIDAYTTKLLETYELAQSTIDEIYTIATDVNKAFVDENLGNYYKHFNTDELGGVHYSQIDQLSTMLTEWLKQWQAAK